MALFRFIRTPKPQRFAYRPRFWNPEKEDLENRIQAAQNRQGSDPEAMKSRITSGMRRSYRAGGKSVSGGKMKYNLFLLGIIGALVVLSYYILIVYLPQIEKFFR